MTTKGFLETMRENVKEWDNEIMVVERKCRQLNISEEAIKFNVRRIRFDNIKILDDHIKRTLAWTKIALMRESKAIVMDIEPEITKDNIDEAFEEYNNWVFSTICAMNNLKTLAETDKSKKGLHILVELIKLKFYEVRKSLTIVKI